MKKTFKIALCGILVALAFALGYIEMLVPLDFIAVPGVKPGFANLVIMTALYTLGLPYAAAVSGARMLLSFSLFGSVTSLLYSLAGGALSLIGMWAAKKSGLFGHVGVSVCGAVLHNAGQLAAAALITGSASVLYYAPVLLVSAAVFGTVNGLIVKLMILRVIPDIKKKRGL